ncbi:dihydropteroate synthase [Canibacter sp. lx-45]|uniref:dihydropteroate synthase n=1 Tax=Canibacter zhuwentaonis TaxID=2837491 RepID=UPI001BDC44C7|nr:dihydropteroate synthase [Canibacter zhuwentaonis]MBT1035537.1 dihydropteroate synthase [Canibacter zhuwentaonis]
MTLLMGILNLTPDSFSDGGEVSGVAQALAAAQAMADTGAAIIDIGGESTRPGSERIAPDLEQRRILDAVSAIAAAGHTVSVDTVHVATAKLALARGAKIVNDVSGGLYDPLMLATVAQAGASYIIGHWRGFPKKNYSRSVYRDVVVEVCAALRERIAAALAAGISPARIIVDPGLGFDKTPDQCWELLNRIEELQELGYPVLIGASRKRMIADCVREAGVQQPGLAELDAITALVSAHCARAGVWGVRVHSVPASALALRATAKLGEVDARPDAPVRVKPSKTGVCATAEPGAKHDDADACAMAEPGRGDPLPANVAQPPAGVSTHELDVIAIKGLAVFARHGVFEHEKQSGQTFYIDCEVRLAARAGSAVDDIAKTVNYAELAAELERVATETVLDLIETLAEKLAAAALSFAGVCATTVTVHKPSASVAQKVSDILVTVTRTREAHCALRN